MAEVLHTKRAREKASVIDSKLATNSSLNAAGERLQVVKLMLCFMSSS